MSLTPGTRLGPYEVIAAIGAGGMGEVYRARDGTLNREVALKVLPDQFALDAERLARFRREAQVLAALNHPNIAAIYGFEESTSVHALVLELVEGPTLADRLAHGAMPVDEALPIARQIAEALETAHEVGIIHRDLKPANIKVRADGTVKVLDFGLAKLADPAASGRAVAGATPLSMSPTITSPAMMTGVGMILGTAAYMSPEQARGKPVDKRADIWAFGCLLYEMLAGKRALEGDEVSDTLAAVLRQDIDWNALPASATAVRRLLVRCLERDVRRRLRDIGEARIVLEDPSALAMSDGANAPLVISRMPLWRRAMPAAAATVIGALLAGLGLWLLSEPAPAAVVRTTISTTEETALALEGTDRDVAITPDGSRVVYRGVNSQILVRALDQLEPMVLGVGADPGPGPGARSLFISPDGQWIGFFLGSALKKVSIGGGPPVSVAAGQGGPRGATWGPNGTIIFATLSNDIGLKRVSAGGGDVTVLTRPNHEQGELAHLWPEFLPGGNAVLFTITPLSGNIEDAQIAVLDLQTSTWKVLLRGGSHAHYVSTGHLVYGASGTLRAVAFDLPRLAVAGTPVPVLDAVVTTANGAADVAVAANGSLVYVPTAAGGGGGQTVVAVDRQGRASSLPGLGPGAYRDVRVSPDGKRLALATQTDIWIYDFARAALNRLTTDAGQDTQPIWTPDGQRIVFTSNRAGYPELFWRAADGTGRDERFLSRADDLFDLRASGWSADGSQLLFSEVSLTNQSAIGQIAIDRPSEVAVLLKSDTRNDFPAVSPDGRWMAYRSAASGRGEIYVERYPELGQRQLMSTGDGGRMPVWSPDGKELFFGTLSGRQMLAVAVQSGATLVRGRPQVLFEFPMFVAQGGRPYDIAPDGRFLMIRSAQADAGVGTAASLIVVQNWFEELKRLVPVH